MKKNIFRKLCTLVLSIIFVFTASQNLKTEAAPSEPYIGQICLMAFNFVPYGWMECKGQVLTIQQNSALASLLGNRFGGNGTTTFALPDLRDASPVPNAKYYIASQGIYPTHDGGEEVAIETFIGQIELFPYWFVPDGWVRCAGQSINISSNTELYDILGTTFGGNGTTTFALPNLSNTEPDSNLHYCIATSGNFPVGDGVYSRGFEDFLGSVNLFKKSNKTESGFCDGGVFSISANSALYSLLGINYGGDGSTNFWKPDLRGIAPDPNLGYYVLTQGIYPTRE